MAGNGWLAVLASIAGPASVAVVQAIKWRNNRDVLNKAITRSHVERSRKYTEQPKHWSHKVSATAFLALPLAQWIGYVTYRTAWAFFVPLAVALPVILVVGLLRPRALFRGAPDYRAWAKNGGLLSAALLIAFVMPVTGTVLVLRGCLIDVLALFMVSCCFRLHQDLKSRSTPV